MRHQPWMIGRIQFFLAEAMVVFGYLVDTYTHNRKGPIQLMPQVSMFVTSHIYLGRSIVKSTLWAAPLDDFLLLRHVFALVRVISTVFAALLVHALLCNAIVGPTSYTIQMQKAEAILARPNLQESNYFHFATSAPMHIQKGRESLT